MARYHNEFKFNAPINERLFSDIHQYLLNEGYEYRNFEGENVYKKGKGLATAPTFVKIMADGNRIVIEAWIKTALLPGVYVGESGIDGFYGAIPKGVLGGRVRFIETMIMNNGGVATGATAPAPNPPAPPAYGQPQNPPVQPQQPPHRVDPGTQQEFIFCTKCGNKMVSTATFCTKCGNRL